MSNNLESQRTNENIKYEKNEGISQDVQIQYLKPKLMSAYLDEIQVISVLEYSFQ
jgi:hypothetical protein